jgi:hypothetical protein
MNSPFDAATRHIETMEERIRQQQSAIDRLKREGKDTSEAAMRLNLLRSALDEMRLQLARLIPTPQQVAAPDWALPLGLEQAPRRSART